jgi:A/G-specific adenine glycosylase
MNSATWTTTVRRSFQRRLLDWYDGNRRELPWRETKDAYRVWVSEIMLQQTRVGAVLDHYRRFLERFPTVESLARAREQSVLAQWSGLGYYRRARNMHACAKMVVAEYGGKFPQTTDGLIKLPGIGRYTAGAIASIAFGQKSPVVDGNVERVMSRLVGEAKMGTNQFWELAELLLSESRPGDFNQAMMEMGATVCLPREPRCLLCPVMKFCQTRGALPTSDREQRIFKAKAVALVRKAESVWLVQRAKTESLMPGMWELPEIIPNGNEAGAFLKHSILNTDYLVSVYLSEQPTGEGIWTSRKRLEKTALTGLSRKVLRHFRVL